MERTNKNNMNNIALARKAINKKTQTKNEPSLIELYNSKLNKILKTNLQ